MKEEGRETRLNQTLGISCLSCLFPINLPPTPTPLSSPSICLDYPHHTKWCGAWRNRHKSSKKAQNSWLSSSVNRIGLSTLKRRTFGKTGRRLAGALFGQRSVVFPKMLGLLPWNAGKFSCAVSSLEIIIITHTHTIVIANHSAHSVSSPCSCSSPPRHFLQFCLMRRMARISSHLL